MPKKNSKGKKKGKGENANKTTTPAFLLPSTSTGTVAPTLDNELTGLPETPGKETSEIEALQGQALDRPSTPIVVVRDPSSTTSFPPQDAAAVLAALAARSPRPISPRPAPLLHPTAPDVFSQTIASPTRAIDSKLDTDGASSIHSNTAPSVIKGSYGKGVSFIPSSQLVTAPEYNADQSNAIAQAERPSWGRSASGAAREIVKSEAKKGKNALKKKHAHPDSGRGADEIEQVYNAQVGEDPVVEKEVDEMVKKGKIKVGVEPRLPDNVPPVKNRGQRHGDEEEKDTNEKKEKKQERNEHAKLGENVHKQEKDQQKEDEAVDVGQTSGRGEPHQAEHQARRKSVEHDKEPSPQEPIQPSSGARTGDSRSHTMIPPKEAHDEMTNESEIPIDADTPLRQRRRGLLGAPLDNPRISNPVPDSDEDRVLNEVKEKSREASTERSRFARSSSGQVYIPPYKTRKPYDPCPLAASEDKSNLALALSTTITRHSLLPFTSTRRVEIRLAWKEPTSWKWIPMRRYIPDWTVEYVGKRSDDQPGMIRKVVRGVVSFIPVVGRFADWI